MGPRRCSLLDRPPGRPVTASCLGGHLKTGQSWTGQNRPVGRAPQARGFYRIGGRVRKSAVTGGIAAGPVGDDAEAAAGRK
jgi:hypothetical protein